MLSKRKIKSISAIVLITIFILSVVVGCSNSRGNTQTQTTDNTQTPSTGTSGTQSDDTRPEDNKTEGPEPLTLPIVDEPLTLSLWVALDSKAAATLTNLNEQLTWQEYEKRTGIHIDFIHPPAGQEEEQLNLMIASNELPDMIFYGWKTYPGGPQKAIDDGVIIVLNELIEKYAPNLQKIFEGEEGERIKIDSVTDEGYFFMMPGMRVGLEQRLFEGFQARKDWIEKLNLEIPRTIDDWYEMLTAFKTQDPNGNNEADEIPFLGSNSIGAYLGITCFLDAWGIYYDFYVDNGQVKWGPITEEYRDYLETMKKWYSEGLIDPDYMVSSDRKLFDAKVLSNVGGSYYGNMNGYMGRFLGLKKDDPDFSLTYLPPPVRHEGDKAYSFSTNAAFAVKSEGIAITTTCKHPVEAIKWIDYQYSEEGRLLVSFGVEGVTYTMQDGNPVYTDLIMNNPDGLPFDQALSKYCSASVVPRLYQDSRYWAQAQIYPSQKEAAQILMGGSYERVMPYVYPTSEESTELALIMNEANTYRDEMIHKFITGNISMDEFDNYVNTLKNIGIERAIEIMQNAYNRYMNRLSAIK